MSLETIVIVYILVQLTPLALEGLALLRASDVKSITGQRADHAHSIGRGTVKVGDKNG